MVEKLEKVRGSCVNLVFCIIVYILKIKVDINRICLFMVKVGSYFYDFIYNKMIEIRIL